ncbi:NAD(+)/NADH kinase [bacterium]|nr:NAD(+)/NADH kinase [bacterium]
MNIKRAVVVYKKSSYELYALEKKDPHFLNLLKQKHPSVAQFIPSHEAHHKSIDYARQVLSQLNIETKFIHRARKFNEDWADLIITIGGDGTFLDAARHTLEKPMLGINSDPKRSVGMYCAINVKQLKKTLNGIMQNNIPQYHISRLQMCLNEDTFMPPVLNDCLITSTNPAETSRFDLKFGKNKYSYKSSGLWVSTAAGSTGAMRSTGGEVLPLEDESYMFYVRENYHAPLEKRKPSRAVLNKKDVLHVVSKMRQGMIFFDGAHKKISFKNGNQLSIQLYPKKLKVFAYDSQRRHQFDKDTSLKRRAND